MTNALDDLSPEQRAGVLRASQTFIDNMTRDTDLDGVTFSIPGEEPVHIDLKGRREKQPVVSAAVRNTPQLRMGETPLNDGTLESLLEDLEDAKARLTDAKGYLEDYLDQTALTDGEYRVGRFRVSVETKRKHKVSIPKKRD